MESKLKPYSLGIVISDKPPGSSTVLVSPMESFNVQSDGKILDKENTFTGDFRDSTGKINKTENTSKDYIKAKWLPLGTSNRSTPPDVVAGETILIYKFANVEEYFWEDIMAEPELRRLEDVFYAYSNQSSGQEPHDINSSYWMRISTRDKFVQLHTCNNDGEPFVYDIKIDTAIGSITIQDDAGNHFKLNSPTNTVEIETQNELNITTTSAVNVHTTSAYVDASNSAIVESPEITLDGMTTVTKDLTVLGTLNSSGSTTISSSGMSTSGSLDSIGSVSTGGSVSANGNISSGGTVSDAVGNVIRKH